MKGKEIVASISSCILLFLVRTSMPEPIDPDDLSKEQKSCMFECLTCVEVWGSQYDGENCATSCIGTNGASIDRECKFGVFVGKRYQEIKAKDECKKHCRKCSDKLPKGLYSGDKCVRTCEETKGRVTDNSCTHNLTVFDIFAKYRFRQ